MNQTVVRDSREEKALGSSVVLQHGGWMLLGIAVGMWCPPGQHLAAAAAALGAVLLLSISSRTRSDARLLNALQKYAERQTAKQA